MAILQKVYFSYPVRRFSWLITKRTMPVFLAFRRVTGLFKRNIRYTSVDSTKFDAVENAIRLGALDFAIVQHREPKWVSVYLPDAGIIHTTEFVAGSPLPHNSSPSGIRAELAHWYIPELIIELTRHFKFYKVDI